MKRQLPSLFEDKRSHFCGQGNCYGDPLRIFGMRDILGKRLWDMGHLEQLTLDMEYELNCYFLQLKLMKHSLCREKNKVM